MKGFRLVLEPAKGALIVCALSLSLALALAFGLAHYHKVRAAAFAQSEAELKNARSKAETLADDFDSLTKHLTSFKHLVGLGLIGDPEREVWVKNLELIFTALDLPRTLHYSLALPQPLVVDKGATASGLPPSPTKALRHDLDIELSGIHEGEFLTFIETLRADWQVPFRIESCQMMRQQETGMQIKCKLRLFSLPLEKDGQQAGS